MGAFLLCLAALGADGPKTEAKVRYEHRPAREAKPGDTAWLWRGDGRTVPGADGLNAFIEYWKFDTARDKPGMAELVEKKLVVLLDGDTEVRVIDHPDYYTPDGAEVRVLSGPAKGKVLLVRFADLSWRREAPTRKARKSVSRSRP